MDAKKTASKKTELPLVIVIPVILLALGSSKLTKKRSKKVPVVA